MILWILLATFFDGILAFTGAITLIMREKTLRKILYLLVAFSSGALLGGGFLHLLAESLERLPSITAFSYLIFGFSIFFLMEKFLYWHHCHENKCKVHPYTYLILFGDGIHNFIDGLVIAASFSVNVSFGIITTFLIIAHEIPQEIGDFGVLLYGGMQKIRALLLNFLSQLTCVIGGLVGFFTAISIQSFVPFLLPFAAGGFIYIAASDLIPELHKQISTEKSILSFLFFLFGVGFLMLTKLYLH